MIKTKNTGNKRGPWNFLFIIYFCSKKSSE